jgi:aminopeptidase N
VTAVPEASPARNVLTRSEAEARAARVSQARYTIAIDLPGGSPSYEGRATIEFELARPGQPLSLDFTGQVTSFALNGETLEPDHARHHLAIPPAKQVPRMRVEVGYRNECDQTGDGFHRFLDPEDGREYLYSNFQPFAAHRLFPCFDQPDIKGTYRLSVRAPADWEVVSAEPELARVQEPDGRHRHEFGPTPPFSTYLLPLVAGPFVHSRRSHDGIPLGLYARHSMRPELDRAADELFEVTGRGFDFYRELFVQPYPFRKYDQLFMPEFNAGAMENVGAVTFHDSFLFRDPPTYGQRLERAEVVLHELAHMWFGNLVTTRWWDDLWLNESFATYISFLCLAEATDFRDAWQVFNGQLRPAAYRQDQLVTTHPIAADAPDTEAAVGNFDAITYEKGAAVLKQLVASIGREAFRDGMRLYFRRHAWGNATLADFLAALGEAAGRDLDDWATAWLRSPGVNTLGARWTARDGRLAELTLWQTAPEAHPLLRPHAMRVGLVHGAPDDGVLAITSLPAVIAGAEARVDLQADLPAPVFVFPNLEDHDYALTSLDQASVAFVRERLPELPDPLLRQQVWSTLWEMVRDARLPSPDYLAVVRRFAPAEPDAPLVESILSHAVSALTWYVPEPTVLAEASALVAVSIEALRTVPDPDRRITWARTAAAAAASPVDLEPLFGLLDGEWRVEGFTLDQDMRWNLAVKAAAHDRPDATERLALESARDRSDRGARAVVRATVSRPDPAAKSEAWRRIHEEGYGSDYLTRVAMAAFIWPHQRELLTPYREAFFERVRSVHAAHDHAFARAYVRYLVPDRWAEPAVLDRIRDLVARLDDSETLLRRQLEETADDLARIIHVQALARRAVRTGPADPLADPAAVAGARPG